MRRARPYLLVAGLFWGLPAAVVLLAQLGLSHERDPACSGWCFSPAGGVLLLAMVTAPFLLVAGLGVMGVVQLVRGRRSRTGTGTGTEHDA